MPKDDGIDFEPIITKDDGIDFEPLISGTVPQIAGDVPTPSDFRRLLPTREELPELAMSLPSKVSPGVGAVLGAGGEAVRQMGERFIGEPAFRTKPPETSGEAAKRLFYAGLRGAGANILGKGVEKVLGRGAVTAESEAARKAAESVGIKSPLGTLTESRSVQVLERGLEFTPFGVAITKQRQKALVDFTTFTKGVGKRIGVDRPAEITGNLAKEELANLPAKFGETTDKMYDTVIPLIRQANPTVELKNTVSKLDDIIANRSGEFQQSGLTDLRRLRAKLTRKGIEPSLATFEKGKEVKAKVFEELKQDRTNLGLKLKAKFGDPSVAGLEKDLKGLYGAMTEDLNLTVKKVSETAFNDLQAANEAFKEGQEIIKSTLFKQISKANPENVYKFVIVPKAPQNVEFGRELLGDTFNDVARQWFDDIVRTSESTEGIISPVKLAKKLKQYEDVIPSIAEDNPALLEQFAKLKNISNLLSKGRDVSQGSVTAFAGAGLTTLGATVAAIGQLFSNPMLAAKIAGGVAATGLGVKGLTSDIGREFLTRGFPRVGTAARRVITPTAELGLQKAFNLRDLIREEQ